MNEIFFEMAKRELILKGYSGKTIKSYLIHLRKFSHYIGEDILNATQDQIKSYIINLLDYDKVSHSYANQAISAISFMMSTLRKEPISIQISRPKKEKILPKVLSHGEVFKIINALDNIKHKAILFVAYSAGLRVSEVASL